MLFDISELAPEGVRIDEVVSIPEFPWEAGETIVCDPAHLTAHLRPGQRGIEMHGHYSTVARLECARCLAAVPTPLDNDFRLFLVVTAAGEGPDAYDLLPDDDPDAVDLYPLSEPVVDLAAVLREQIDLALPMRAVCKADCRGLCTGCGADLNLGDCRCQPVVDERWSGLLKLREELQSKKDPGPTGRRN